MMVAELARAAAVTPHVVRHYTRIGLLKPFRNEENGYKLYNRNDLNRLMFIRRAKYLGYTLADIRGILDEARHGNSPCPHVRRIIQKRIEENRAKLSELAMLQNRMEDALREWSKLPDGMPNGDSVCYLIESMVDLPEDEK
ncbi:MAG TPA: MerR family transcriptional regulator [Gammaproteobacteria bacterium]|nr:MerR family transcriptional regulator [Gammaproteobacteria bacterium]